MPRPRKKPRHPPTEGAYTLHDLYGEIGASDLKKMVPFKGKPPAKDVLVDELVRTTPLDELNRNHVKQICGAFGVFQGGKKVDCLERLKKLLRRDEQNAGPAAVAAEEPKAAVFAASRRPRSCAGRAAVTGVPGARGATSPGAAELEQKSAGASIHELPEDLQFEIVARSEDAATVVRCAAASKPLRRAILGQGFRRRLALRAAANDGFDPANLVAVSYRFHDLYTDRDVVQPSGRIRFETSLLQSFQPASSRDGLLVLCRDQVQPYKVPAMGVHNAKNVELLVCNAFTGHVASLPRIDLGIGWGTRGIFWPALLTVDGASSTFEMLVMEQMNWANQVRTQTLFSEEGEWGHVREVHVPRRISSTYTAPVVIGRTIHWLCKPTPMYHNYAMIILALQADTAQATVIELPWVSSESMGSCKHKPVDGHGLILATTAEGTRLSLVVAETLVISMWTLLPEEGSSRWSQQVVIRRREIDRPLTAGLEAYRMIRFCGFGERSGTVLFWMYRVGLVQLNLGSKKALVLRRWYSGFDRIDLASLHEINLVSLLEGMNPF